MIVEQLGCVSAALLSFIVYSDNNNACGCSTPQSFSCTVVRHSVRFLFLLFSCRSCRVVVMWLGRKTTLPSQVVPVGSVDVVSGDAAGGTHDDGWTDGAPPPCCNVTDVGQTCSTRILDPTTHSISAISFPNFFEDSNCNIISSHRDLLDHTVCKKT